MVSPRKYVLNVTSLGERSSPWTCNSMKDEIKFHLECKLAEGGGWGVGGGGGGWRGAGMHGRRESW